MNKSKSRVDMTLLKKYGTNFLQSHISEVLLGLLVFNGLPVKAEEIDSTSPSKNGIGAIEKTKKFYVEKESENDNEGIGKEYNRKNLEEENEKSREEVKEETKLTDIIKEEKKNQNARASEESSSIEGKSGITPQTLAIPEGTGTIQGMGESYTPNLNNGTGSYGFPISVPLGRNGIAPSLGISYSTSGGNSVVGWGWGMGIPFISRQTDKGMPRYDDRDRFVYGGGQEIVPVHMPLDEDWPNDNWNPAITGYDIKYYRSRFEGEHFRFFYNKNLDTWLVQDRAGNHYYYGEGEENRISGTKGTFQWAISRMSDVRNAMGTGGNDIHYEYATEGGSLYIKDIYWNSYQGEYGILSKYQHQVKFIYEERPDRGVSYATGFRVERNVRLRRIEVRSYGNAPSGERSLIRAYLFEYESPEKSIHTRLKKVQVCGKDWKEGEGGTCYPPMQFQYSQIQGITEDGMTPSKEIYGFGSFNEQVRKFVVSPDVSTEDANVDMMDVNQDGLPDLLITKPEYFGKEHAAILNDGYDGMDPEKAIPIENPSGWSLNLENLNVSIMDIDGSGNADLLHMPYGEKYHYYKLKGNEESGYGWKETDDIPLNDGIDFTQDAMDISLVDINNDHLIDIVRTTGTRMEHYLNLSSYPGYDGQFGRLDDSGKPVPNESIDSCILMRGGMMQFHEGNLRFGDMNGDGLQDIVDLKKGSIAYWPNRGYGQWGDSEEECVEGEYVDGTEIEMGSSPWYTNPDGEGVSIADLNGDGLSDLVQIRFDSVDIWFNNGNDTFSDRYTIEDTPKVNSGYYGRVRFADVNGSGTVDILWADAGGYQYLDLAGHYRDLDGNGGMPSGLLERVKNSVGGETRIEYAPSTEYMLTAKRKGEEWDTVTPMPLIVVKKVTSTDNLDKLGGPRGEYGTEYIYRDPYYDAHEAEFKGFGYVEVWDRERDSDGDGEPDPELCTPVSIARGEAPIVSKVWFHRGIRPECMIPAIGAGMGPDSEACAAQKHRDNPLLGLTGAVMKKEVYSPCTGETISASLHEIEVRKLLTSSSDSDERDVYGVFSNEAKTYSYDPARTREGNGTAEPYAWITLNDIDHGTLVAIPPRSYTPASPDGTFHRISSEISNDNHGMPGEIRYEGFHDYTSDGLYEYSGCDDYKESYSYTFDSATWIHTLGGSKKVGTEGSGCSTACTEESPCSVIRKKYNEFGELTNTYFTYRDYDGSNEKEVEAGRYEYNAYGQVTDFYGYCAGDECERHTEQFYTEEDDGDLYYSNNVRKRVVYTPDAAVKQFVTKARWDAGTGQILGIVTADGAAGAVGYDALGRLAKVYRSNPVTGELCPEPAREIFYHYGDEKDPMSMVETWVNTSPEVCGNGRWEVGYSYADSNGNIYANVVSGDKHLGTEAISPWMMQGVTELNAKGKAISTCEALPLYSPPRSSRELISMQYSTQKELANQNPFGRWNCAKQEFDAFGRPTYGYVPSDHPDAQDGYVFSKTEYGVDEVRYYSYQDLTDADHLGTYSSTRVDGLGRAQLMISRHKEHDGLGGSSGDVAEHRVTVKWGGDPGQGAGYKVITKDDVIAGEASNTPISRRVYYDSLGRVRVNIDPNAGRWEYRYDDMGQLVGTTSPMGNTSSYSYDSAGRLLERRYNGETDSEYFYDIYPGDTELGLSGNLEWEGYPDYSVTLGGLVAIKDNVGVTVMAADRGLRSETWRQIEPSDRLYHFETRMNFAGELVWSENPDGNRSTVEYYDNGAFKSSYFDGQKIVDRVRSNMHGQVETLRYGDAAETEVWTGYNPVTHQAMNTVVQQQNRVYEEGQPGEQVTLMAFGYQYDVMGRIKGISDWRGRGEGAVPRLGLSTQHPTAHTDDYRGYHQSSFPSHFDGSLAGPKRWNSQDVVVGTLTGWPVGATPSDSVFGYDTRNRLVSEDREYITANGADSQLDEEYNVVQERVRTLDWSFDVMGSMTEWLDGEDSTGQVAAESFGRALGRIENGYQLNVKSGNASCMNALASGDTVPAGCYIPEAIYFATNIDDVSAGKGTCIWTDYNSAGQMRGQIVRTGCTSCSYEGTADGAVCPGYTPPSGSTEDPIVPKRVDYTYSWNRRSMLSGAVKEESDKVGQLVMSYHYDASGARIVREKFNYASGDYSNIRQDLYISGGYERRQVQLIRLDDSSPTTINDEAFQWGLRGQYQNIAGTRTVKYAWGMRIDEELNTEEIWETKRFLSFGNHLGSTSVVIDFDTGALVEWSTQYAYGADESHWRNLDPKYTDQDEKFTSYAPYKFTGKEEDKEVGLHYFGARYYSAYLGRWLSPDAPVTHGIGVGNSYDYSANNPYNYTDPDGNSPTTHNGAYHPPEPKKPKGDKLARALGFAIGVLTGGGFSGGVVGSFVASTIWAATQGATAKQAFKYGFYSGASIAVAPFEQVFNVFRIPVEIGVNAQMDSYTSAALDWRSQLESWSNSRNGATADSQWAKEASMNSEMSRAAAQSSEPAVGSPTVEMLPGTQGGGGFKQAQGNDQLSQYGRQQATPISGNEEVMNRRISYIKFSNTGDTVTAAEFSNASAARGYITTQELNDYAWENSFSLNNSNQREVAVGIFDSGDEVFAVVQTGEWGAKQVDGNFLSNTMSGNVILLDEFHTHPWTDRNQGWLPTIASGNASQERGDVFSANMLDGFAAGYAGESGKEFIIPGHYILTHPTPQRQGEPNRPWLYRYSHY